MENENEKMNPRYVLFCQSRNRTIEEQRAIDNDEDARVYTEGYQCWILEKWDAFCKVKNIARVERHFYNKQFDIWLRLNYE